MNGIVSEIQRFSVHDGPGIRTTVFLKGCPMRCLWCHNPETADPRPQVRFSARSCVYCGGCAAVCRAGCHTTEGGTHRFDSTACTRCGACVAACPSGALSFCGQEMTAAEVLEQVGRDCVFYGSDGGMTLSGGEPFLQGAFAVELLRGARARGITTAVETCGMFDASYCDVIADLCDTVFFDIKAVDRELHRRLTGCDNAVILSNLRRISARRQDIVLRTVIVRGMTDGQKEVGAVAALAQEMGLSSCPRLLAFHPFGSGKAGEVGEKQRAALGAAAIPTDEEMNTLAAYAARVFRGEEEVQ